MDDSKENIAILGGRGMLGTDLSIACKDNGIKVDIYDLPDFDITNTKHLKSVVDNHSIIINCAAYTNVDGAESQAELAYDINANAVGQLGDLAKIKDTYVVHISTDFVFDGTLNRPYTETDETNPINTYGKTKLEGENLLRKSGCNYCIIRVQWTYGKAGNNFITKLIEKTKTNNEIMVVDDQVGSPTATTQVAKMICKMIDEKPQGLFHFASDGYVSRYDMAKYIFDRLGITADLKPCKTADFISPAKRPLNSCFDCKKISGLIDKPIESWQDSINKFLEKI